jgi:hypothetical protein
LARLIAFLAALTLLVSAFGVSQQAGAPPAHASPTTTTVYWGNYTVDAFTEKVTTTIGVAMPCTDCYLTVATPDLEWNNGGTWEVADYSNGAMLHHMVIFNHAYIDPTCGGSGLFAELGDRFFASGNERGTLSFPPGYGYYLPGASPDNYWNLNVMIHNLSPDNKTFRVKLDVTYHPVADNLRKMRHIWLDQNNCSSSQYPICASGPYPCYNDKHWDWTSGNDPMGTYDDIEGTIVGIGGHVHDWGISTAAQKVQTGEYICTSVAGFAQGSPFAPPPRPPGDAGHPGSANSHDPGDPDYNGHIESMSACTPNMIIASGDTIRLHTQYNATSSQDDVMGIMGAWLYDNCDGLPNPDQHDNDTDLLGDLCDPDADGDGTLNTTDDDDDADGALDVWETACGTQPLHGGRKQPERVDGPYAGVDDDSDAAIDEALPGGALNFDCDGDGYKGSAENHVFSYLAGPPTNGDQKRCQEYDTSFPTEPRPSKRWPADLRGDGISLNKINVVDLGAFITPARRMNTSPGDPNYHIRWDLVPGTTIGKHINVSDIAAITSGVSGFPPMLNGLRAFGGPICPT